MSEARQQSPSHPSPDTNRSRFDSSKRKGLRREGREADGGEDDEENGEVEVERVPTSFAMSKRISGLSFVAMSPDRSLSPSSTSSQQSDTEVERKEWWTALMKGILSCFEGKLRDFLFRAFFSASARLRCTFTHSHSSSHTRTSFTCTLYISCPHIHTDTQTPTRPSLRRTGSRTRPPLSADSVQSRSLSSEGGITADRADG